MRHLLILLAPMTNEDTRKKLLFRAWHRGTREMDLMVGRFAEASMAGFSEAELREFEALLLENDPDLYNWVTGQESVPENSNTSVLQKLIGFYK